MNTAMFLQYATDEPFLNGELAKQYFEMVSEPKKVKIYDAPHASAPKPPVTASLSSRSNSRSNRRTNKAIAAIPVLVQPLWLRPPQ